MATEFCQKCKQAHPGRACDYDDQGECSETLDAQDTVEEKPNDDRPPRKPQTLRNTE